jgi:YidC/Oxa1 family membrane protein insertase
MFWIQDLSAQDPYYITPLLMGVTMLISMKMTPTTTTDPMQSKMMMIMPVMMTFMFLTLSAGLNLYFLFSNVFSIAMQKVSERFLPAMKAA